MTRFGAFLQTAVTKNCTYCCASFQCFPSPLKDGSGKGAVPLPRHLTSEWKMARFGAFWLLFLCKLVFGDKKQLHIKSSLPKFLTRFLGSDCPHAPPSKSASVLPPFLTSLPVLTSLPLYPAKGSGGAQYKLPLRVWAEPSYTKHILR